MCGIVGHIGVKGSVDVVLEGLKRLEYRGYDSSGVSFINSDNEFKTFKKKGKLENLLTLLNGKNTEATFAIGHTRWATHGEVNDLNAHPHTKEDLSLVHNGIIENSDELRDQLKSKGFECLSETDTEVFLGLISTKMKEGLGFRKSLLKSFEEIKGNSAFVVIHHKNKEILAIKKGAPLVCGLKSNGSEAYVSSDPYALIGMAEDLYFPEDNILCSFSQKNENLLSFFDKNENPSQSYTVKEQGISYSATEKGDYEHFMLKEIYEQPRLIRSLGHYYFQGAGEKDLSQLSKGPFDKIYISACGTAAYAGMVVRDYFENFNRIPSSVELGSEFRYRNPILTEKTLGLFISQSGETADTLAAQNICNEKKIETVSLVNVEGSTLYRECDHNLLIKAGIEIGVASTKAFTQMSLTGRLMSFALSKKFGDEKEKKNLLKRFNLLANRIDGVLENSEEIKLIAEEIYNKKGYFFTGRNIYYPTALEGALKLKEIAYVHAEGYASGELKHGPIALIDEEMVNIAIAGPELLDKTISNIQEIKARKGIILSIGPKDEKHLKKISDYFIPMNFEGLGELSPLYVNVVNQLLAYYMAKFKGTDIDKPRNLAKSVTVE